MGDNQVVVVIPPDLETEKQAQVCIYKVPPTLREVNPDAYTPRVISIGPIHRRNPHLKDGEKQKLRYYKEFDKRLSADKSTQGLREIIRKKNTEIRQCYAETTSEVDNAADFEKMVLLDAIFIIELLLRDADELNYKNDFIVGTPWLRKLVRVDLILLENQLPYFILKELYDYAIPNPEPNPTFINLVDKFFSNYKPKVTPPNWHSTGASTNTAVASAGPRGTSTNSAMASAGPGGASTNSVMASTGLGGASTNSAMASAGLGVTSINSAMTLVGPGGTLANSAVASAGPGGTSSSTTSAGIPSANFPKVLHFTDVLRDFISHGHPTPHKEYKYPYSVTRLHEAGVKFRLAENKGLLDIKFTAASRFSNCFCMCCCRSAELRIPCLKVDDTTEHVYRNLMALEQCHYPTETYICSYIRLMDDLIDTTKDVDLLVEKKIIVNRLGSNAVVAHLFNKLCLQITEVNSCYYVIAKGLNEHYNGYCSRRMATLRRIYFPNIWRGTATIAAALVLLFTFGQLLIAILQAAKVIK